MKHEVDPEWEGIYELVRQWFDGDELKARLWFRTVNPRLDGRSPASLISLGRYSYVKNLVEGALRLKDDKGYYSNEW